jgi:hypothetical protein
LGRSLLFQEELLLLLETIEFILLLTLEALLLLFLETTHKVSFVILLLPVVLAAVRLMAAAAGEREDLGKQVTFL